MGSLVLLPTLGHWTPFLLTPGNPEAPGNPENQCEARLPRTGTDFTVTVPWRLTLLAQLGDLPPVPQLPLCAAALDAYAARLTVQVWNADGLLGTGTLLGRTSLGRTSLGHTLLERSSGGVGWVLTNDHVLRWATPPFQIHLSDRTVFAATWQKIYHFDGADLAILRVENLPASAAIQPEIAPPPAAINPSSSSKSSVMNQSPSSPVHSPVFAAGWIIKNHYPHWQFLPGTVGHHLGKPLTGGYQFGYSSAVKKGMSGGPVLNAWGQLVGINGMVADPLWKLNHTYEDGTALHPSTQYLVHTLYSGYSWGIPSDRFAPVVQEILPTEQRNRHLSTTIVGDSHVY